MIANGVLLLVVAVASTSFVSCSSSLALAANSSDTVDLPQAMPPVMPTGWRILPILAPLAKHTVQSTNVSIAAMASAPNLMVAPVLLARPRAAALIEASTALIPDHRYRPRTAAAPAVARTAAPHARWRVPGLEVGGRGSGSGDERSASRSERAPRTMPPGRRAAAAAAAAAAVPQEAGREKAATSEATMVERFLLRFTCSFDDGGGARCGGAMVSTDGTD